MIQWIKTLSKNNIKYPKGQITIAAIFDVSISILFLINLILFFSYFKAPIIPIITGVDQDGSTLLHIPQKNNEELDRFKLHNAIDFFHLPFFLSNSLSCFHPASEISCSQIINAWEIFHSWENSLNSNSPLFYCLTHTQSTLFSDISQQIICLEAAIIMGCRLVLSPSSFLRQDHPSSILFYSESLQKNSNYSNYTNDILTMNYTLSSLYSSPFFSNFSKTHFGAHAAYFLLNYLYDLIPINDSKLNYYNNSHRINFYSTSLDDEYKFLKKNSKNQSVRTIGIEAHFPTSLKKESIIKESRNQLLRKAKQWASMRKTDFLLFSNSGHLLSEFRREFGIRVKYSQKLSNQISNISFNSLFETVQLLLNSDETIMSLDMATGAFLSRYLAMRTWWLNPVSGLIYSGSNSQAQITNILALDMEGIPLANDDIQLSEENENDLRYLFKYLSL